jgi:hypothetical protein
MSFHLKRLQAALSIAPPAVVNSFVGNSSTLAWDVSGATAVSIDNGIGPVAAVGSMSSSQFSTWPYDGTKNFTLTATIDGQTTTASVSVFYAGCFWATRGRPEWC